MTTEPARLAGIPVLWCKDPGWDFPSTCNHACWVAQRMNQVRNKTAGNTLFMHIVSPAHVSRRLLWVYCHAVYTWKLWNLPLSWFVYERIWLNLINPRVLKIGRRLHVKMLDSALSTVQPWKKCSLFTRSFCSWNKILRNHLLSKNNCNEMMHHSMLPLISLLSHALDHGSLRDIFFGTWQLRAKILSNSWQ